MGLEYIESEKLWRSQKLEINFTSLGQAILGKLSECCEKNPNRVLEVYHENGLELTVKDVRFQTVTVAQNLLKMGVKKGDTVILFSKSNAKLTPITFACYTIGAVVNFFDINFDDDRISYAFEQIDPTVIIFEEDFKDRTFKAIESTRLSHLKHVLSLSNSASSSVDEILFKPTNNVKLFKVPYLGDPFELPAILAFTSGSTGMPKLAIHSHAMMLQGLFNGWWQLWPGSVVCILCDLRWICQIEMMLQPVFFDVKRVLCLEIDKNYTCEKEAEVIRTHGLTHFSVAPMTFLDTLRHAEKSGDISSLDSLKTYILVGEPVGKALLSYARKIIPHCKIVTCYGMTELPGMIATDEFASQSDAGGLIVKNGFSVMIADKEGKPLGPNARGRLLFKSEVPILGYFRNEDANKATFTSDGWFDTQDYAFVDDNNLLTVVTRMKFLLHGSGKTVIPSDVEDILNAHEGVYTSVLIGHPNLDNLNELGTIFVVLRDNKIENQLKNLLKTKLTKDQLEIVKYLKTIPNVPLTQCTKTNRKALRAMASEISSKYLIEQTV